MKKKTDRLIMTLSQPLEWAEKALDFVFTKAESVKKKFVKKSQKKAKDQQSKKDLIRQGKDQDLDVLVANYKAEKGVLKPSKQAKKRLQKLTKKQANKQQER